MYNLITGGVMSGLVGAHTHMKLAGVSMNIYTAESKKQNPDEEKMKRALGYATDSMNSAMKEKEKASKELGKAIIEAREQEKAEAEAKIEKARKEKADSAKTETKDNKTGKSGDTVEISEAGKKAAASDTTVKTDPTEGGKLETQVTKTNETEPIPQVYTPSCEVKAMETGNECKISVAV